MSYTRGTYKKHSYKNCPHEYRSTITGECVHRCALNEKNVPYCGAYKTGKNDNVNHREHPLGIRTGYGIDNNTSRSSTRSASRSASSSASRSASRSALRSASRSRSISRSPMAGTGEKVGEFAGHVVYKLIAPTALHRAGSLYVHKNGKRVYKGKGWGKELLSAYEGR